MVSLTARAPAGAIELVVLVDVVDEAATEVVLLEAFVVWWVAITSPPLDAFQYTAAPARGDPSSAALTDITDD